MKIDTTLNSGGIEVDILFVRNEQKDRNGKPEPMPSNAYPFTAKKIKRLSLISNI